MNKWYKSNWMKGLLCILVCLSMISIAVCSTFLLNGLTNNITWHDIINSNNQTYVQSEAFSNTLNESEGDILSQLFQASIFETDGVFDEQKIIDISEFKDNGTSNGKNISGFAYRLGDLLNWYDTDKSYHKAVYVVCQKTDGTYYYYSFNDFKKAITENTLSFNLSADDTSSASDILDNLSDNVYTSDSTSKVAVLKKDADDKMQLLYSDCWTLTSSIPETFAPVDADSIVSIANTYPAWNGKLSDMLLYLDNAISTITEYYAKYSYDSRDYSEGNTNLAYLLLDRTNHKVHTNRSEFQDYDKADANLAAMKKMGAYVIVTPELKGFESNLHTSAVNWQRHSLSIDSQALTTDFFFALAVDTSFPIQDAFYTGNDDYETYMPYVLPLLILDTLSFLIFLTAFVWITIITGRSSRTGNLVLNGFDKIWTEVAATLIIGFWVLTIYGIANAWDSLYLSNSQYASSTRIGAAAMTVIVSITLVTAGFLLLGWTSLIRRIKARSLWRDSILCKLWHLIVRFFRGFKRFLVDFWNHRQQSTQIILITIVLFFLHIFAGIRGAWDGWPIFLVMFVDIATAFYLIHQITVREKIKAGIREISEGNVTYRIDLTHLKGNDLEVATLVNNIGNGLHAAVDQSMKDERMKADLITNVSHDIKTPLTSIINYVDLLKRENFTDPKVVGYIDILEQKAQRLKTLTEDVVEASKVSSGNVTLELMNINLVEMLNQIEGEFIEKFESRNLSVVMSIPEEPVVIYADGRRLSRILENLYNNAYKYAMEDTRIYADLRFVNEKAEFSLKNISEQALNISANELTERFIRGDVSRTTEGSGLGLSIAKSLTELQGGTFELYLDGDLFKVTITFPVGK